MRTLLAILLTAICMTGCKPETKTEVRDATVWEIDYLDLTGHYLADAKLTEAGETDEFEVSFQIVHTGPATEWFGVMAVAEPNRIVFNYNSEECLTKSCSVVYQKVITGEATADLGKIHTVFRITSEKNTSEQIRDWEFTNIRLIGSDEESVQASLEAVRLIDMDVMPVELYERFAEVSDEL